MSVAPAFPLEFFVSTAFGGSFPMRCARRALWGQLPRGLDGSSNPLSSRLPRLASAASSPSPLNPRSCWIQKENPPAATPFLLHGSAPLPRASLRRLCMDEEVEGTSKDHAEQGRNGVAGERAVSGETKMLLSRGRRSAGFSSPPAACTPRRCLLVIRDN
uniref:Uncharacterized protein n=10 Tax=Aegilops tauschii subsp. strangulata TaxID=200361 RepID=A0A453PMP4_AEGTS